MRTKHFAFACVGILVAWGYLPGGGLLTVMAGNPAGPSVPVVAITQVPAAESGGPDRTFLIAGTVRAANPAQYKVVIYAHAGDRWWVQPTLDAPLTDVRDDGRWQTDTHGGAQYAALLVTRAYQPKATLSTLPQVGGDVAAMDRKAGGSDQPKPPQPEGRQSITIVTVPPMVKVGSDTTAYPIAGTVAGVGPAECKVVIYAYAGDRWWVQPLEAAPLTDIAPDGTWYTQTHPGYRYAALLVKGDYQAQATLGTLPKVGGDVLAVDLKQEILIRFSGYEWVVKTSGNRRVGPGPNYFSEEAVSVDNEGLHLRVLEREGKYLCAEVVLKRSLGYGRYRFVVGSNVDDLDANVVLGLFTWSDDPAYSHREIDVEISSWGKPGNDNAQYVIQPYNRKDNIFRFAVPHGLGESSYSFLWTPARVLFQGDGVKTGAREGEARVVCPTRTFTQGIPQAGDENARINLWLMNGRPPGTGTKEILIREFRFEPVR